MRHSQEELEKRLSSIDAPPPPEDLLDRIKNEIPEDLGAIANSSNVRWFPTRWLAAAASLVAVAGAAWFGLENARNEGVTVQPRVPISSTSAHTATVSKETEESIPPVAFGDAGSAKPDATAVAPLDHPEEIQSAEGDVAESPGTVGAVAQKQVAPPSAGSNEVRVDAEMKLENIAEAITVTTSAPAVSSGSQVQGGVVGGTVGGVVTESAPMAPPPARPARRDLIASRVESAEGRAAAQKRKQGFVQALPPSTGGSTEPNDEPYGDVFFRDYGTNPFIDTDDDRFSTFAMDVDTASFTILRRYLDDGNLPPASAVRVEEMLNYFNYRDAAPRSSEFALYADAAPSPFPRGERYAYVRFGVKGRQVSIEDRKPANLVFVIDVSGSMDYENRLGLVKRALSRLLDALEPNDRIGVVVFGNEARTLLHPTRDREVIRDAIYSLNAEGSTNAAEGLRLGYRMATESARRGAASRIILCSDGVANVGSTSAESILRGIGWDPSDNVEITTVGFGMGNYNDVLMEQLANKGNGRYAYVDRLEEAQRIFVETLSGTLQTIARDAKIQVEFNPAVVSRYRLIGYENRDVADNDFRNDQVDAGEVGAGQHFTALYEVKFQPNANHRDRIAALRVRYQPAGGGRVNETGRWLEFGSMAPSWQRSSRDIRLATLVSMFGEKLKKNYWAKDIDMRRLLREIEALPDDTEVEQLKAMARRATRLMGGAVQVEDE